MKFLKKVETHEDDKKVVSARVPRIVLDALDNAKVDLYSEHGYTFSVPRIIEKALKDTLDEIKNETGFDFYELEKFKHEMNDLKNRLNESAKGLNLEFDESIVDYLVTIFQAEKENPKLNTTMLDIINRERSATKEHMHSMHKSFLENAKSEK